MVKAIDSTMKSWVDLVTTIDSTMKFWVNLVTTIEYLLESLFMSM